MAGIVIGAEDARMGEMREPWPVALQYCIIENHQMDIFLKIQNCCYAKCPERERERIGAMSTCPRGFDVVREGPCVLKGVLVFAL